MSGLPYQRIEGLWLTQLVLRASECNGGKVDGLAAINTLLVQSHYDLAALFRLGLQNINRS